jgi:hypothetical protein
MFNWRNKQEVIEDIPEETKPAIAYFKFGLSDDNRVVMQCDYNEISMNKEGCQDVIDQLTFYMNRLQNIESAS